MRKLLYILPVILILGFAACENYVDITPTGKKTVDSTDTYYELIALPNRAYHPAAFALLSDNVWSKESNIIGNEFISWDGINMTFNEAANRKELSDNNLYENCYLKDHPNRELPYLYYDEEQYLYFPANHEDNHSGHQKWPIKCLYY